MKLEYKENLKLVDNKWNYSIKFIDNIYTMVYKNIDIFKCLKIRAIINNRINKFVKHEIDTLKTSDLGLEYIA